MRGAFVWQRLQAGEQQVTMEMQITWRWHGQRNYYRGFPFFSSCSWISLQNVQITVYTDIAILKGDPLPLLLRIPSISPFIFGFSTSSRNWTKSWGLLWEQMAVGNGDKKLPVWFFSRNIDWSFKNRVFLETCDDKNYNCSNYISPTAKSDRTAFATYIAMIY